MKRKQILIIILITISFFIGIVFNMIYSDTYNQMKRTNKIEQKKYDNMLSTENKTRIIEYLSSRLENGEIISVDVFDYLFKNIYNHANFDEKFNIYNLYFQNVENSQFRYYDIINQSQYNEYLRRKMNDLDFYNINDINKLDNEVLKSLLKEMKLNHFKIKENNPYLIVSFDYEYFLNKFRDILDNEYLKFTELERQSNDIIINPNFQNLNMEGIIWNLINYEDFIKTTENEYLAYASQHIYVQNLGIFFGVSNIGLFYENEEEGNYNIKKIFLENYDVFLEKYHNYYTSEIIKKIKPIIENNMGKESITDEISRTIYDYLENSDWVPLKPSEDNNMRIN